MPSRKTFNLRTFLIGTALSSVAVVVMMQPLIQHRAEQSALKTMNAPVEVCESYEPGDRG